MQFFKFTDFWNYVREKIRERNGTKFVTYRQQINPELSVHRVYTEVSDLPEHERVEFTRIRVFAHNLAIEKGRWSRIKREERYCSCGPCVQTENHALLDCPVTLPLREKFRDSDISFIDLPDLFASNPRKLVQYVYQCMKAL